MWQVIVIFYILVDRNVAGAWLLYFSWQECGRGLTFIFLLTGMGAGVDFFYFSW
jgi:hypothetical protein